MAPRFVQEAFWQEFDSLLLVSPELLESDCALVRVARVALVKCKFQNVLVQVPSPSRAQI